MSDDLMGTETDPQDPRAAMLVGFIVIVGTLLAAAVCFLVAIAIGLISGFLMASLLL